MAVLCEHAQLSALTVPTDTGPSPEQRRAAPGRGPDRRPDVGKPAYEETNENHRSCPREYCST